MREALRALEQAGLVEIRRGRHGGAYVLQSDRRQSKQRVRKLVREMGPGLDDAIDFRHAIEPEIVELAAARRTEEQVELATGLLEESKEVPGTGFRGADSRFHLALAAMANSPSLSAAATDVQVRFSEILTSMPILAESIRHSHAQHRKILARIEAGDGPGARVAMVEHIDATAALLHGLV